MPDLGALYRASRLRVGDLLDGVDPATGVPATPGWSAHDLLAHVAGIAEDAANENMAGAPGDAWTAAQVARGRAKSVDELRAQWAVHGERMEAFLSSPAGAQGAAGLVDVNCHEADLRHAFGLPPAPDEAFVGWAAPILLDAFHGAASAAGLPAITVRVEPFELIRSRLGRRTAEEAAALEWSADPAAYLDIWFMFGPRTEPLGEAGR